MPAIPAKINVNNEVAMLWWIAMPVSMVNTEGSSIPPTPTDPTSIPTPTTASNSAMPPNMRAPQTRILQ
ncbi:hypothetical protein SFMTTN_1072 [Sulfuriferula multivorans]|uniref:Uncharacterized protein n=1 Tax=Sulfuriferula multivorans TaxID=1559896 RepID=A0A401JC60_9PROT|nr:hypothetical protein SFMTTN_1072 [Sulfuriferula multivorans]